MQNPMVQTTTRYRATLQRQRAMLGQGPFHLFFTLFLELLANTTVLKNRAWGEKVEDSPGESREKQISGSSEGHSKACPLFPFVAFCVGKIILVAKEAERPGSGVVEGARC